jgi:hypothetical protein
MKLNTFPNILEYSQELLRERGTELYPAQKALLAGVYANDPDAPIPNAELLIPEGENWDDIRLKVASRQPINDILYILGRRSGKDFLESIMACYELRRLLAMDDPHSVFGMVSEIPITVLFVSASMNMTHIGRNEVVSLIQSDPILSLHLTECFANKCVFKTKAGNKIDIQFSSYLSERLLGLSVFAVFLSEASMMKEKSFDSLRASLIPSLNSYTRREAIRTFRSSKMAIFTSPRQKDSSIHQLFKESLFVANRISASLPTWSVSDKHSEKSLRESFSAFDDERFMMEFGAEFQSLPSEKTEQITFRVKSSLVELLKQEARQLSFSENDDIAYTEVIRRMIDGRYR